MCELYSWLCQRLVNAIFVMHWPKWMPISVEFVWKCCCYYYYLKSFCRIWNCVIKRYIFGWLSPFRLFSFFKLIFRCCLCFARSGHFISKHKVFRWTRPCACIFSLPIGPISSLTIFTYKQSHQNTLLFSLAQWSIINHWFKSLSMCAQARSFFSSSLWSIRKIEN